MKKKVLSLLFACVLVISALVLVGCKTDDLEAQINENATKAEADLKAEADALQADLKEEAEALQKKLDETKAALEKAIAVKADKAALETAVADFNAAVEAAEEFATAADATLKTELTEAIAGAKKEVADSVTALSTTLDTKVAELNALIKTNKDDVATLNTAKTAIEKDIDELQKKVAALTNTDMSGFATDDELAEAIEDLKDSVAEAQAAALKAYITIETWNGTTEEVIEYLYKLEVAYNKIKTVAAGIGEDVANNVFGVYNDCKVRLYRAIDKDSAKAIYDYADGKFTAISYIVDVADEYAAISDQYYDAQLDEIEKLVNDAIKAVMAVEITDVEELKTIKDELAADLADVATKAEVDYAKDINDRVAALIAALAEEYGYNATSIAEYGYILADIDAWVDVFEDEVNKVLIDAEAVEELKADYADVVAAYEEEVAALTEKVAAYVTNYTYNYDAAVAAEIYALKDEATLWLFANTFERGFEAPAELYALVVELTDVVVPRAEAMDQAKIEADALNKLVADLYAEINVEDLLFKSEYKTRYEAIADAYNTWIVTYFAGDYAAEKTETNVNYNLVNHKAFADLKSAYETKFGAISNAIDAVEEAFGAADFKTITTNSGAALDAATKALTDLTNLLVNLDLDAQLVELGLPSDMTNTLANKKVAYNALIAERDQIFADLKAELDQTYADLVTNTDGIYTANGIAYYKDRVAFYKAAVATFNADKNSDVDGFVGATEVDAILANADLQIAKAEALVAISKAYKDAVYTDNAAGDVAKALAAVKATADANVIADTAIADITVEVAEASADIAEIQVAAKAYNDAIADLANVTDDYVNKAILADANESLNKAIARIVAVKADAIAVDETYALANAELELVAHIIKEYVANSARADVTAELMIENYKIYEGGRTPMDEASDLENEKIFVTEHFAAVSIA